MFNFALCTFPGCIRWSLNKYPKMTPIAIGTPKYVFNFIYLNESIM